MTMVMVTVNMEQYATKSDLTNRIIEVQGDLKQFYSIYLNDNDNDNDNDENNETTNNDNDK